MGSRFSLPKRWKDAQNRSRSARSDQGQQGAANVRGISSESSGYNGQNCTDKTTYDAWRRGDLPAKPSKAPVGDDTAQTKQPDKNKTSGESNESDHDFRFPSHPAHVEHSVNKPHEAVGQTPWCAEPGYSGAKLCGELNTANPSGVLQKNYYRNVTNGSEYEWRDSEYFESKENIYTFPEEVLAKIGSDQERKNAPSNFSDEEREYYSNKVVMDYMYLPVIHDVEEQRGASEGSEDDHQPARRDSVHVRDARYDDDVDDDEYDTEGYVKVQFFQREDGMLQYIPEARPQRKSTVHPQAPVGRPSRMPARGETLTFDNIYQNMNDVHGRRHYAHGSEHYDRGSRHLVHGSRHYVYEGKHYVQESRHLERKAMMKIFVLMKFDVDDDLQHKEYTVQLVMLFGLMKLKTITDSMEEHLSRLKCNGGLDVIHELDFPVDIGNEDSELTVGISKIQWMPPCDVIQEETEKQDVGLDRFCDDSTPELLYDPTVELLFWQRLRMTDSDASKSVFAATVHFNQANGRERKTNILKSIRELHQSALWDQHGSKTGNHSTKKPSDDSFVFQQKLCPPALHDELSGDGSSLPISVDLHSDSSCPDVKADQGLIEVRP